MRALSRVDICRSLLTYAILLLLSNTATAQAVNPAVGFVAASNARCSVGRPNVQPTDSVTWSGTCRGPFAHGLGVARWFTNGEANLRYEGDFIGGLLEGKGKMTSAGGDSYTGEFLGGLFHGHGIYLTARGERHEGQYVRNQRASLAAFPPPVNSTSGSNSPSPPATNSRPTSDRAADGLSNAMALRALKKWNSAILSVSGVREMSGSSAAQVDFVFNEFLYSRKNYDDYSLNVVKVRYSGPASAEFHRYNDGRWVLKSIELNDPAFRMGNPIIFSPNPAPDTR